MAATAQLERAGIEVYLPQTPFYKRIKRRVTTPEPLFPGYFFSKLDPLLGETRLARYTGGVLYVVGYGDEPWPVPEGLIESIRQRLSRERSQDPFPQFKQGEKLVITGGPLKDVEAIFDRRLSGSGRARVLIRILERLCGAEVHFAQLLRATQAAG